MSEFVCVCGNCKFTRKNVDTGKDSDFGPYIHNTQRAGTFIYTKKGQTYVLLVQSYNGKWGPPKGKIENGETALHCAIRETYEETGLSIKALNMTNKKCLHDKWTMFNVELKSPASIIPQSDEITGSGWFSLRCLKTNRCFLNHPAKLCIREFLGVAM